MNKSTTGRHFELTTPIKTYAANAIDSLGKYHLDIISVGTVIAANEKRGKKGFAVEFIINLKNKNTIVITQVDKDVYAAIDIAIERAKKKLRRHSERIKTHKIPSLKRMEGFTEEAVEENTEPEEMVSLAEFA